MGESLVQDVVHRVRKVLGNQPFHPLHRPFLNWEDADNARA